jgi:hypothetical protein
VFMAGKVLEAEVEAAALTDLLETALAEPELFTIR